MTLMKGCIKDHLVALEEVDMSCSFEGGQPATIHKWTFNMEDHLQFAEPGL